MIMFPVATLPSGPSAPTVSRRLTDTKSFTSWFSRNGFVPHRKVREAGDYPESGCERVGNTSALSGRTERRTTLNETNYECWTR